jgi:hypothetical protein
MDIHVYIHSGNDSLSQKIDSLTALIGALTKETKTMSLTLDNVSAKVDALIAADAAETTVLVAVKAALDAAIAANNNGPQLQALSDKLDAEITKVQADTAANTPAPPAA